LTWLIFLNYISKSCVYLRDLPTLVKDLLIHLGYLHPCLSQLTYVPTYPFTYSRGLPTFLYFLAKLVFTQRKKHGWGIKLVFTSILIGLCNFILFNKWINTLVVIEGDEYWKTRIWKYIGHKGFEEFRMFQKKKAIVKHLSFKINFIIYITWISLCHFN
jgi:hypothetical protein